jgi:TolA-binding protein
MLASIAFNRSTYEEAADLFTQAHAAHPEHERATANLAHAELLLGVISSR